MINMMQCYNYKVLVAISFCSNFVELNKHRRGLNERSSPTDISNQVFKVDEIVCMISKNEFFRQQFLSVF